MFLSVYFTCVCMHACVRAGLCLCTMGREFSFIHSFIHPGNQVLLSEFAGARIMVDWPLGVLFRELCFSKAFSSACSLGASDSFISQRFFSPPFQVYRQR